VKPTGFEESKCGGFYASIAPEPCGSHAIFQHPASAIALSVPARKPIKPVYVRKFLQLIDEIESQR
jgi:predicted RNA binding protein YcfA (HicA-like mRNA interferase family)